MGTHYNVRNVEWGKWGKPPFQPPERIFMRKSSITLKHFKEVQVHHFLHNSREKPTSNSIFDTKNNYTNRSYKESIKTFWKELNKRIKKYTERTGKKLPKNTIKHISGIFNIDENTTMDQIKKVIEYLEKSLDTKVIQYSIHKDEGHIDPDTGEKKINYHVHVEMLGLDSEGRSVRKKIDRKYLINLQTEVSKILGMERGESVKKTRRKRLDTYEYKKHKKLEDETIKQLKQQIKELKKENEKLKLENTELKEEVKEKKNKLKKIREILILINKKIQLYTKEDYKELSNIKKQLKNVDSKLLSSIDNSIDELVDYYINKLNESVDVINQLTEYIKQLEQLKTNKKRKYKKEFKL